MSNVLLLEPLVRAALIEDLGRAGDLTSEAIVAADTQAEAVISARVAGRVAGLSAAVLAFRLLDPQAEIDIVHEDGAEIAAGGCIAVVRGHARALLAGRAHRTQHPRPHERYRDNDGVVRRRDRDDQSADRMHA